ncbi:hypothetical protein [Candidatus Spongiihabitans sp.]|uniref:hypothetical protein n=1 Tax=Candidatus Spongiihabitans sp. TaxID=3101308 RepID=UPI003C6F31DA
MINESQNYMQVIHSHRNALILWLGMAGVLLLLLLLLMPAISLLGALKPLGLVTAELELIEHAKQRKILGKYPQEIAQLSKPIYSLETRKRSNPLPQYFRRFCP